MTELPEGWAESSAGELCHVVGGATPRTDTDAYWGGDIPWITPDDLSRDRRKFVDGGRRSLTQQGLDSCAATLVPAGTVLFTSRAPIGYTAIASRPIATNQGFKSLVPSGALTSDFLYWQLQYLTETIRCMGSGTTFAEVSKKVMVTVPLRVAPLAEQERIVAAIEEAFSKLDAGEAGLRTVRQLLKRMRDAILAAAVAGRLVPQDPTDTPATKLLADLGIEPLEQDELPDVPDGWAWALLGSITAIGGGIQKQPKRAPASNPMPFLRVANVGRGTLDLAEVHEIEVFEGELSRYGLARGDLLVVEGNGSPDQIGRSAMWHGDIEPCVHQNHLIRVRPTEVLDPSFLEMYWNSPSASERVQAVASSTSGLHTLSTGKLKGLPVVLPPVEEQARIVTEVERQMSFVEACERAVDAGLERSAALRRSVLTAAFQGRLVPQDPTDEPASVLLERVRGERAAAPMAKTRRARTKP